jgi:thiamine biosynthesis lipoprotein
MLKFFLCLLFPLLLFISCQKDSAPSTTFFEDNVMTINYHITIGTKLDSDKKQSVEKLIASVFSEINFIYNKWNPNSEISKLNRLKANEIVPLSAELEDFLKKTQQIVELSEGLFDPTIEPLQRIWKQHLALGEEPSQNEIQAIMPAVGWDKIHFENGFFSKDHDLTSIDLGGIAKGYCVDLLVERLNAEGYKDVFVEWGGEIRASGQHPANRPWHIFISRLEDTNPTHAIAHLDLHDEAIATSGDYLQNWKITRNGVSKVYFHILDPRTGYPLISSESRISSASVLAPTCMFADGLATVAMMFSSVEEAKAWSLKVQEKFPEVTFWMITKAHQTKDNKMLCRGSILYD